jgi:hypothetical protein
MSSFKLLSLVLITSLVIVTGCKKQPSVINFEQAHNPASQKIMAPGLGTIGIIKEKQIFVYYLNESHRWILDKVSQFEIPENTQGVLALGMGFLGVVQDRVMYFYYLDAEHQWTRDEYVMFVLPRNYERLSTMRMPWDVGQIVVEEISGLLSFYYIDESGRWIKDETAEFVIPPKTDDYLMIGDMEIGIIKDNKLGVYQLTDEGEWVLAENMVLALPDDTQAVLSFESGIIAVLSNDILLRFFELDTMDQTWYYDESMDFVIPEL